MTTITATIAWHRRADEFKDNRYSRTHTWRFDGGAEVAASSSPHVVPVPMSDATAVDPEEAFVASLSSCHMLWFLSIAAKMGFVVEEYVDNAEGELAKDDCGNLAMTVVTLRPLVRWSDENRPFDSVIREMHERAHDQCFIANSVKTAVWIKPEA